MRQPPKAKHRPRRVFRAGGWMRFFGRARATFEATLTTVDHPDIRGSSDARPHGRDQWGASSD